MPKNNDNTDLLEAGKRYAVVADKSGLVMGIINTPRQGPSDVPVQLQPGTSAYRFDGAATIAGRKASELVGFSDDDLTAIGGKLEKNKEVDAPVLSKVVTPTTVVAKND